jgi:hypothetical protein
MSAFAVAIRARADIRFAAFKTTRMTHNVILPLSIAALQNDQTLCHASDIRRTETMEYLPATPLDHSA